MQKTNQIKPVTRFYSLDHLKVLLIMLVVAHHAGQPYGGSNGFWYYKTDQFTNLGKFFSVNAGFFMSLFFLISAYFLPASLDKKGAKRFLKDRVIRLGIPLLFGFFVMMPLLLYVYFLNFRDYGTISFFNYYLSIYFGLGGQPENWSGPTFPDLQFGHLWFIEHLLFYALIYCLIRYFTRHLSWIKGRKLTNSLVLTIVIFISFVTYLIRIWYPIDYWEGFLGIIQAEYAHSPQYISSFIIGIIAFRNKWFDNISARVGVTWLFIGSIIMLLRYTTNVIPYSPGGFNGESLIYSFAETFLCFGLNFGLIFVFIKLFTTTNSFMKILADNSYSVYIFHLPILVILQYSFDKVAIGAFGKFTLATIFGIVISFGFSFIIRKLTFIRKIL